MDCVNDHTDCIESFFEMKYKFAYRIALAWCWEIILILSQSFEDLFWYFDPFGIGWRWHVLLKGFRRFDPGVWITFKCKVVADVIEYLNIALIKHLLIPSLHCKQLHSNMNARENPLFSTLNLKCIRTWSKFLLVLKAHATPHHAIASGVWFTL